MVNNKWGKEMNTVMFGATFSLIGTVAKLVFMILVIYYLAQIAKKD